MAESKSYSEKYKAILKEVPEERREAIKRRMKKKNDEKK